MHELPGANAPGAEAPSILKSQSTRHAVRIAVAAALAGSLFAGAAIAQVAPAATDQGLQEIVVTGSLIKRSEKEGAEAVTILKADALKAQGITSVEQILSTLTSQGAATNIAQSTGTFSGGGSYANLRGIGESRTLVLLDGQRLAPNAFDGHAVDISGIPFAALDSVEILHEGASALYGSDAIAGVINFKTKKNYQGVELQGNIDRPQESGGGSHYLDATFGHGDLASDGYNLLISAGYHRQEELQATQRAFSAQGFNPAAGIFATNNPGSWPGSFLDANGNLFQSGYPTCAGNPQLTKYFGNCAYRYSAATDLLPDSREYSGMVDFTKTLPANNQIELQYFYTHSYVNGYSGPIFYFFQMDPNSPYYPKASQLTCITTPGCTATPDLADGGDAIWSDPNNDRYGGNVNSEQRILLTFSGSNGGWDYSTTFNYSQNKNDNRLTGGYPNEALLAPGGVLSDLINPFGPQSAAGQALINSSYVNGTYSAGKDKRWDVGANASHPLGDAFNAGTPATVAVGIDVNGEKFTYGTTPYNDIVSPATGLSDSQVEGSRNVQAAYLELDVPITKRLDVDISDREDRYSDFGTTNNGKISVRYAATDWLTLRGAASTGFRAPSLFSLYSPNFVAASSSSNMGQGNPFCTPSTYTTLWTQQTCNTQGLGVFGGNPHLTPETSQNFNYGIVLSPVEDLGITLDFYRILIKNSIGGVPASAIYANPTLFASYIVPATSGQYAGTLTPSIAEAAACAPYTLSSCGYIKLQGSNTGGLTTDGIDISVLYAQHTSIGTFSEDLEGTAVTQFLEQQYTGGPTLNLVGWYNTLAPAYRWQHNLRANWTSPGTMFGVGVGNRFYSRYIDEFPDGNGNQRNVGSYSLWDVYGSYKPLSYLTVLLGVKNVFNTSPPLTNASQGNFAAGYNSLNGDPLLRNFYLNVKLSF